VTMAEARHRTASRPAGRGHARFWRLARVALPAATFAVLLWRLGTGPFLDGLRTVDAGALAAATGLAALTTVCCAWRWRTVARGLGLELPLGAAVAAYYRSLFLNVALPGGVLGDVHRGVSHGRDRRDVGRGLRAVAWERSAGQVVQAVLTLAVLVALPSPVQRLVPYIALALILAVAAVALGTRAWPRVRRAAAQDLRAVLARRAWPAVALASALIVAGHTLTFLIAAQTAGASAPPARMVPLALLALLGAALPNVGGWGPREGVTAWAFAAGGLGASRGVATAVVYGVMVFVATLPGAAVLAAGWLRGRRG
jgi:glycosyltransferase 2 family protein